MNDATLTTSATNTSSISYSHAKPCHCMHSGFQNPPTESDGAIRTEEDITSLEVPVDAAFGMEALQCLQHLVSDAANLWL